MAKMPAPQPPQPPQIPMALGDVLGWCRYVSEWIKSELSKRPPSGTVQDSVLLVSPGGAVYSVKVTDAGALVTEKVAE